MRFLHLSDLHLGKRLNEFSLLDDQAYILKKVLQEVDRLRPDAVVLAGDIYDKSVPSAEAVQLLDDFLCRLAERDTAVLVISGNHDSPERLAFGGRLMAHSGVHLCPVYDGKPCRVTLQDAYGPVHFYLLPFLKPAHVRRFFPDAAIESYTDALAAAIENLHVDTAARNVLVTHQFVTGAARCDSEDISVGGADNVDAAVFDSFDYVALGHIHSPQNVGGDRRIRYCGTPLKYSFSEAGHRKSVTVVTLGEKGDLAVDTAPLAPLRDLRELKGSYMELTARSFYQGTATEDYLHITLTDEEDVPDAAAKLRVIYPNLMKLDYDNRRTRAVGSPEAARDVERKTPLELFGELYEKQNGQPMSDAQLGFCKTLMEKIWEGDA